MRLALLYRGPLASCNYGCGYCPFAGGGAEPDAAVEEEEDRAALARFVDWVCSRRGRDELELFFTPRGEALVHQRYQEALVRLSRLPHVGRVAFQTNLSGALGWAERCDARRVGIWATYHPRFRARGLFVERCIGLAARGLSLSVGAVGDPAAIEEIEALRAELPREIYLWINAIKREPELYAPEQIERLRAVDPLFDLNRSPQPSRGRPCRAGSSVVAVDGLGTIRRCHFLEQPLGELYDPDLDWTALLARRPRPCPAASCRCHIGYVHLEHLALERIFGEGILERAPLGPGGHEALRLDHRGPCQRRDERIR